MVSALRVLILVLCVAAFAAPVFAQRIDNWAAPLQWSPEPQLAAPDSRRALSAEGIAATQAYSPLPFIGLTPCRIADTRGNGFTGPYGPPSLSQGSPRNFPLSGQCGIPSSASAVSLNITVTNTQGPGFIKIYPQGGTQPTVSTLNYVAGETVANAAVVPLGTAGGITVVAGVSGTDLIIDTNGYYAGAGTGSYNTFLGLFAGNSTMTGDGNTGIGLTVLSENTSGSNNTALGLGALAFNTSGSDNTALGADALLTNHDGSANTAVGHYALISSSGSNNTAVGDQALNSLVSGIRNIGIGANAGYNLATGDDNIFIANLGLAVESNTIRIGQLQNRAYMVGIYGVTTGLAAVPVVVDANGQLGTASSSARAKEQIRDMGEVSSALLKLRPVTFHYKGQARGSNPLHFGLIAEEVDEVLPELVVHRPTGEAETVLYHEMPAMLLNELQKQQRTIERQQQTIEEQRGRIAEQEGEMKDLGTRLLRLEERFGKSAAEVSARASLKPGF
jgi:Chaperone of endosialidase